MPISATPLLKDHTVLVVEDELLIALDAEHMMLDLGADKTVLAANVEEAIQALARETITLALLDVNLGKSTSFAVADGLAAKGIPFAFASGYGSAGINLSEHRDVPVIGKPYTLEALAAVISVALAQNQNEPNDSRGVKRGT